MLRINVNRKVSLVLMAVVALFFGYSFSISAGSRRLSEVPPGGASRDDHLFVYPDPAIWERSR